MMTGPAIAGPMKRAELNMRELRAMALERSLRSSIISTTKAWRVGMSKATVRPRKIPRATMCQTWRVLVKTRAARTKAWIMARVWVMMRMGRRLTRSEMTPASGVMRREGTAVAKATMPSIFMERVF